MKGSKKGTISSLNLQDIRLFLLDLFAQKLGIDASEIRPKASFFSIGVSSLISKEILTSLHDNFVNLSSTLLFEQPNINRLSTYLLDKPVKKDAAILSVSKLVSKPTGLTKTEMTELNSESDVTSNHDLSEGKSSRDKISEGSGYEIAVIGISGRFPQADNPSELWENLLNNKDCIVEIPAQRWDYMQYFSTDKRERDVIFSKWGGFINGVEEFDPLFFQISHRDAESMDPQQKLFLQCCWELMEDAGYGNPENRPTDSIGVYVGVTWNEFSVLAHEQGLLDNQYEGAGSLYWGIPNRVSYFLNFKGPSISIDTACSSSLVAVHDACHSLLSDECKMAIAGGVNLNLHPAKYLYLSQNHFLSSDGKCRSFGEGGDGYVPGEGLASILLKPLHAAQQDGDYIYGVIRGSAINHGGKVTGYTVPNPDAHKELIATAIKQAQVSPEQISYIECHGTGTELGDPIEIKGLSLAFEESTDKKQFCAIGSIKSNIGHLEAAAGITGLIKILLSMKHNLLPASLHSEVENKQLVLTETPFYLVKENQTWNKKAKNLLAGISSFGAGGSNAHLLIENFMNEQRFKRKVNLKTTHVLVFSAESENQLRQHVSQFYTFIKNFVVSGQARQYSIGDIAYSLIIGRSHFKYRLALLVKTFGDVDKGLAGFLSGKVTLSKNIYVGESADNMSSVVDNDLTDGNIDKLSIAKWAAFWSQGLCHAQSYFLLKSLKNNDKYLRLPLPTYPFLKERSWIKEGYPLVSKASSSNNEEQYTQILHPLVDKNISTLYQQRFEKTFHISEFVLKDHLVNEEHVIPGVCHLEMVRLCAAEATHEPIKVIKGVWYYNVISVDEMRKIEIDLGIEGEELSYTIHDKETDIIFSRGKIGWHEPSKDDETYSTIDPVALKAELETSWSVKDVYTKFVATGVIQKESFQVLTEISFSRTHALSKLVLPTVLDNDFNRFVFHPSLMDGLVQTAMMHMQYLAGHDIKILPFHFYEVTFIAPLQQEVYVYCQVVDETNKEFDLSICNTNGELLVDVSGFILKEMKTTSEESVDVADSTEYQQVQESIYPEYYSPQWLEKALLETGSTMDVVLCFIGNNNYTQKADSQRTVISVKQGKSFIETEKGFEIRYDTEDDYIKLVERLAERQQLPQLVIHASSRWSKNQAKDNNQKTLTAMLDLSATSLFLLAKALIPKQQKLQWVVFANGLTQGTDYYNLASSGFFKTVKVEKPSFIGRVISLDEKPASLSQLLDYAERDISTQQGVLNIEYRSGKRFYHSFQNVNSKQINENKIVYKPQGVYLITGGMGGIGLIFAKYLIDNYDANLYLTGRSALDTEKQNILNQLNVTKGKEQGQVKYLRCDVTKFKDVQKVIKQITREKSTLRGVIHSAGNIEDSFILRKELVSFNRVIAAKIHGSVNLDRATQDMDLDFFCLFSSVTAIFGNLGQCDYAYANAFGDNLARYRNQQTAQGTRKGKTLSINWPYWKNGGMQLSDKEQEMLSQTFGITPLSNESGIKALAMGLASNLNQLAVLEGNQAKIRQVLRLVQTLETQNEVKTFVAANQEVQNNAINYLIGIFATELKIPKDRIDIRSSFERYGFDSIVMIDLINVMEKKFKNLPKTLFFEYQSIIELADYFSENYAEIFLSETSANNEIDIHPSIPITNGQDKEAMPSASQLTDRGLNKSIRFAQIIPQSNTTLPHVPMLKRQQNEQSIAIIGLSGRYPQADNIEQFWQNLKSAKDCVVEIPSTHWDWTKHFKGGKPQQGKSYGKWGGFIDNVDQFDAAFFNITPKEAEVIDPQERLFLQCASSAIQDTGYTANKLAKRSSENNESTENPIGVFVGVMWGDYQLFGVGSEDTSAWTTPRSFYWGIANRVSYFHNFTGPSMAIDTACSSSISAIHLACESLRSGEIEVAVAGGVNLSLHPNKYNLLSEMQFLSTDGRCRSFGEGGDGYVPGDGVGAVILKPLSEAKTDGDHIYGVIRGSSLNHGGKTSGFTVPNPIRQASLIKRAMEVAGVSPRHISYVEAHGTGTSLGDPVELIGLKKAYQQQDTQYCAIGSVKSNIGHLEAAAGMAALSKVLLQMKHQQLAPSIHSQVLNSHIDFSDTPFKVQQQLSAWQRPQFVDDTQDNKLVEIPRIAGISSFGAGGSNAHLIVEEYIDEISQLAVDAVSSPSQTDSYAVVFSASNEASLNAMLQDFVNYLETESLVEFDQLLLQNIVYTLQVGREHFDLRCAFLVDSIADLRAKISHYLQDSHIVGDGADIENVFANNLSNKNVLAPLFIQEDDAYGIVDKWFSENAQMSLAVAWTSGVNIDWSRLYENNLRVRRLSLPSYVFNTKKYWTSLPASSTAFGALHPLLDKNVSIIDRQIFIKDFTTEDNLLQHHRINNVATLPAAAYLEMALQATLQSSSYELSNSNGGFYAEINNVIWTKPITVLNNSTMSQVELVPFEKGFIFEISRLSEAIKSHENLSWLPCGQGEINIISDNKDVHTISNVDLDDLLSIHTEIDKAWLNRKFLSVGYEFGDNYDVFDRIKGGKNSAVARINIASIQSLADYILPPVVLDAVFRTCLGISSADEQVWALQIPIALDSLILYEKINQDCVAYAQCIHSSTEQMEYNIDVYSTSGRLLARVDGFKTRILLTQAATKATTQSFAKTSGHKAVVEQTDDHSKAFLKVQNYLKRLLSEVSKIELNDISSDVALEKYGIDSVMIMAMNEKLQETFGELSKTLYFEYQDIQSLSHFFVENHLSIINKKLSDIQLAKTINPESNQLLIGSINADLSSAPALRDLKRYRKSINKGFAATGEQDIAVIGISGRFPDADSVDELWEVLASGKSCIREIPADRWDYHELYEKNTIEPGKTSGKWGGFIRGHSSFDALLFNILPEQAKNMDPQERLFLQCVWATLEDAGYTPGSLSNGQQTDGHVGVFAGNMWSHYDLIGLEETLKGNPTMNFAWDAVIANRVSYYFDFKGPSMTFDTACSTSLLAVHQACESIRKGECRYAIAGGVNLSIHPYKYQLLTQMQMLSNTGRCRSFGVGGDGYVPGEGVATVLLKPLSQALDDHDNIYGVIKSGAINHDGKTNGLTVPNPVAQVEGFENALKMSGLAAEDISYFEAHGTGTSLGDPIEFNAITKVLNRNSTGNVNCAIGSIKSNIGHLEGASGVAGLIKVLLQLKHKKITPSLHSQTLNPNLDFSTSPLYVPQQLTDWLTAKEKRCAAIGSMGAGGANIYLVVEECDVSHITTHAAIPTIIPTTISATNSTTTHKTTDNTPAGVEQEQLFILSAKSISSLKSNISELAKFFNRHLKSLSIKDVAYTLQMGRVELEYRLAVKASSLQELAHKLVDIVKASRQTDRLNPVNGSWAGYFSKAMEKGWHSPSQESSEAGNVTETALDVTAMQWIAGDNINWQDFHSADAVKRISLPGYQFDKTVYWPDIVKPEQSIGLSSTKVTALLDANISSFTWQAFRKTFTRQQFYIEAHKIGEQQILPAAVLLEMVIQAYFQATGSPGSSTSSAIELSHLQWIEAGVVDQQLQTEVRLQTSGTRFEVARVDMDSDDSELGYISLFAGTICQLAQYNIRKTSAPSLQSLLNSYPQSGKNSDDIYNFYASLGLHYGDYFQVTTDLCGNADNALVKLVPHELLNISNANIEPSIFDAALRATLLTLQHTGWEQLLIPHSIEHLQIMSSLVASAYAHVELQHYDSEFKTYAQSDITLYDQQGNICVIITGFKAVAAALAQETKLVSAKKHVIEKSPVAVMSPIAVGARNELVINSELSGKAVSYVQRLFAKVTGIKAAQVNVKQTFESLGVDSITIVKLNKVFDKDFNELSKTLFFECDTLDKVKDYLIEQHFQELCTVCGINTDNDDSVASTGSVDKSNEASITLPIADVQSFNVEMPESDQVIEESSNVFIGSQRQAAPITNPVGSSLQNKAVALLIGHGELPVIDGLPTITVKFGKIYRQYRNDNKFIIRKNNPQDLTKLVRAVLQEGFIPEVYGIFEQSCIDWQQHDVLLQSTEFENIFSPSVIFVQNLIKTLSLDFPELSARILHFSPGLLDTAQPQWEAYAGLANSLADINNRLFFSTIAVHPGLLRNQTLYLETLKTELQCQQKEFTTLEYDAFGNRFTYTLLERNDSFTQTATEADDLPLEDQGVYLISGGAGGLGKIICRYLIKNASHQGIHISVGLLGRSAISAAVDDFCKELSSNTVSVFYVQTDICNSNSLSQQLTHIRKNSGVIKGIIHCAGASANKSLLAAEQDEFFRPLAAKCIGTVNLDLFTRDDPLSFFILFSSIVSQIGDFGAAAYAMGNSFQDNYAVHREYLKFLGKCQGQTQAIAWPLWSVEGISRNSDLVQLYLDDFGLQAINEQQGIDILRQCWSSQLPQLAVYYGKRSTILEKLNIAELIQEQSQIDSMMRADVLEQASLEQTIHNLSLSGNSSQQLEFNSLFDTTSAQQSGSSADEGIAIIGVSGVYPGAKNLDDFWQNLQLAEDSITEIPASRWDYSDYYSPDRSERGKTNSKWGGFIDNVDYFDPLLFNITPREAQIMDPQERLFLQTSYHCVEDAGYCKSSLQGKNVGVYVGVMWGQYQFSDIEEDQRKYGQPGSSFSAIANRVSYYFDFNGPCVALDTMCSSSLTAIHHGRQSLLSGECDYVLAGGVNLSLHPLKYLLLSQEQFLSSDGRCRSFGDGGDGYVPGEGVGVVLLKKLSVAVKDRDHIYGVIKSTAINHGGRTNAFTVPNPIALGDVINQSLKTADWDPRSISYVEAHGTGTPLGDPIEINGLDRAYRLQSVGDENNTQYCSIGSVKSNIGHLESASGIAGLTKILLQLKHRQIASSIHTETLNKNINFEKSVFRVARHKMDWQRPSINKNGNIIVYPRRAGLSSFGAGGSNAHLLVEEYSVATLSLRAGFLRAGSDNMSYLFVFSTKTVERLNLLITVMLDYLQKQVFEQDNDKTVFLANLAFTLQVGREEESERLAIVAGSLSDLIDKLRSAKAGDSLHEYYQTTVNLHQGGLDNILDDEQKAGLVNTFISKGNLIGLAKMWVNSMNVEWQKLTQKLFTHFTPSRISIPCTPFMTQRYWVKTRALEDKNAAQDKYKSYHAIHPLLDKNLSTLFTQQYYKQFTGDEFYLRDHLVDQQNPLKVLPGVAYIEMARAAAEAALGSPIKGIANLMWGALLAVDEQPKDVFVAINSQSERLHFEVKSGSKDDITLHAGGEIRLLDNQTSIPESLDVNKLINSMSTVYESRQVYEYYESIGFKYGPTFRVTKTVHATETEAISHLVLAENAEGAEDFYLHPSLMDAALRTCLIVVDMSPYDDPMVPFAVDRIDIYGPVQTSCYAYAKLISNDGLEQDTAEKFDVTITDTVGKVLLAIKGISARKLSPINTRNNYYQRQQLAAPLSADNSMRNEVLLAFIAQDSEVISALDQLAKNNTVIRVYQGEVFSRIDDCEYCIDVMDQQAYLQLFLSIKQSGLVPTKLLHAFAIAEQNQQHSLYDKLLKSESDPDLENSLASLLNVSVYSMVYVFKSLMQTELAQTLQSIYLHRSTDDLGLPHDLALSGLAKSLLGINHRFQLVTLGVDQQASQRLTVILQNELCNSENYSGMEINYLDSVRYINGFKTIDANTMITSQPTQKPQLKLLEGGCYIITGGLGKLGRLFAAYLLEHWHAKIVLTGRRLHSEDIESQLRLLCDDPDRLVYIASDLVDQLSLEQLIQQTLEEFPSINGVIHSAGIVDDKTVLEADLKDFEKILLPKVHGSLNLLAVCAKADIRNVILFSSVSSFLGDLGGGSYAFANRFLDGLATLFERHTSAINVLSINWPLWETGGMAIPEQEIAFYRFSGMSSITEQQGLQAFNFVLNTGLSNVIVAAGNTTKIASLLKIEKNQQASLLKSLGTQTSQLQDKPKVVNLAAVPDSNIVSKQNTHHYSNATEELSAFLSQALSEVIGIPAAQIDLSANFQSYGVNSLMLMEYNKQLEQTFSGLVKTALFEYDAIGLLTDYLLRTYPDEVQEKFGTSPASESSGDQSIPPGFESPPTDPEQAIINADSKLTSPSYSSASLYNLGMSGLPKTAEGLLRSAAAPLSKSKKSSRIAVIGMSGMFPDAPNLDIFWHKVRSGENCLHEIPENRWEADLYFNQDKVYESGKSRSKWGGFVDNVYHFDAPFFNISDKESVRLDPQLRLMMKISWQTFEDAGYSPVELYQQTVGVYIGVMNDDFTWNVSDTYTATGRYFGPGAFASDISNKISTMLNVCGPSLAVEAACASSSSAIHLARNAIINGECTMALAGGVNLTLHHEKYLMLDELKVLAPDNKEKTFDNSANGLVPSEGVGAVLLKDFQQAVADGDHIYGVLCGSSIGHVGVGPAENLPSIRSLESNIVKAIAVAGIDPLSLSYIESHGTGTELGDPIELKALSNIFRCSSEQNNICAIGTKANFGHLESASGVCGLIKVLLGFKHNEIPPCANLNAVNSAFDEKTSPLFFPKKLQPWHSQTTVKVAGIHSFGLGGSNAFLVVESYQQPSSSIDKQEQIIVLSAQSKPQLLQQLNNLLAYSKKHSDTNPADLAFTLQTGRKVFTDKIAFVVKDLEEFIATATTYLENPDKPLPRVFTSTVARQQDSELIAWALNAKELTKLAEYWVNGGKINWLSLHISGRQKCSLPHYPFAEKEYRLPVAKNVLPEKMLTQKAVSGISNKKDQKPLPIKQQYCARWFKNQNNSASTDTETFSPDHWPNSTINKITCIGKTLEKRLGELCYAVTMTPVQKNKYKHYCDSDSSPIQQIKISVEGALDQDILTQSWQHLASKIDILRSVFVDNNNGYYRVVVSPDNDLMTTSIDHQKINDESQLTKIILQMGQQIRVKQSELPYRLCIIYQQDQEQTVKTHIVWSYNSILMQDNVAFDLLTTLHSIYRDLQINRTIEFDTQPANEQHHLKVLNSENDGAVHDYWLAYLQNYGQVKSLLKNHAPEKSVVKQINDTFNTDLVKQMQVFTQQLEIEYETLFVAVWSLILSRLTKSKTALFAIAGKFKTIDKLGSNEIYGAYDDQVPMLLKTVMRMNISEWLKDVQQQINQKYDYAHVPFDTIKDWIGMDDLCESLIVFEHDFSDVPAVKSCPLWQVNDYSVDKQYAAGFVIKIMARAESIDLRIDYDASRIDDKLSDNILQYFEVVINAMIANPLRNPAAISLMTSDEQRKKFWQTIEK